MLLTNKRTGKMVIVADDAAREKRLVRRLRLFWRAMDGYTENAWFITLTYKHDIEWEPYHISKFVERIKKDGQNAYCWVAEVQPSTGKIHYHVIVMGHRPAWSHQRWGKGRTRVRPCTSIGYLLKYLWKGKGGKGLPKGARRFGIGVKKGLLCRKALKVLQLSKIPVWVAYVVESMGGVAKKIGGGKWEVLPWGIILENEWRAW
jgi:hypothetical protein